MDKENKHHTRKPNRLSCFDYSSPRMYFLTICTENKAELLSRIVGGDVPDAPNNEIGCSWKIELTRYGSIADKYITRLSEFNENLKVVKYVIMPNHIHLMLFVLPNGASRTSPPTIKQHSFVSRYVSTFKRCCNKEYGKNIWQRNFYDHIIRNRGDYEKHLEYIRDNPLKWYYKKKKINVGGQMNKVEIYTDGSCKKNPGPGGWAAVLVYNGREKEICGGEAETTNNRMELLATINALKALKEPCEVLITSDSKYVVDGISKGWARGWRARGWKKSDKSPALNPELWNELLDLCDRHTVEFEWVKGHAGHPYNERCDTLAQGEAEKYR